MMTETITPIPDAVHRAAQQLQRLGDNPTDRSTYFVGLVSAATETAIAGYEAGDEASLRVGLRMLLSSIAASVHTEDHQ